MKYGPIYLQQVGLKQLGFDPGPIDGVEGDLTRTAYAAWLASVTTESARPTTHVLQLERWDLARIKPERQASVDSIVQWMLTNRARYEAVANKSGVPWYVIACLHNMESTGNFKMHLHEGSPLTDRTKYIPKGRPRTGNPPFTWEESALDALAYDQLNRVDWKSLAATLYACERYNGIGYLKYHPETPSPYLWAGTTVEKPGKYTSDGQWSAGVYSKQIGVAAILKALQASGQITLPA